MKKWLIILSILFFPMAIFYTLSQNFPQAGIEAYATNNLPKVYKFSSSMCIDCQTLEKQLKDIIPNYKDKIDFISFKVDNPTKEVKAMIKKYKITLVPTMVFIDKTGKEILKVEGLIEESQLKEKLQGLCNE